MELDPIWLIRFRFAVILGQSLILPAAWILESREVLIIPVVVILGVELLMNLGVFILRRNRIMRTQACMGSILALDVILLTLILFFSGRAMNPFTIFYLVDVAAVAVLLGEGWTWTTVGLSIAGYSALFVNPPQAAMKSMPGMAGTDFRLHLYGMLTSFCIAAICVTYFITLIQKDRIRIRKQLDAAQEKAARIQRFTALTAVAAGAAHELATPLGTITIAAGELQREITTCDVPPSVTADIALIQSQVGRCRSILDQLDPAGSGSSSFRRMTLQDVLDRLTQKLTPDILARLALSHPDDSRTFLLPESRLPQGLAALVKNAIEASPPDAPVTLTVHSTDTKLIFTVRDRGSGIHADILERIGEPFFSTKPNGRGLGLFLARQMMDEYGGNLKIEDIGGGGAEFSLEFPMHRV